MARFNSSLISDSLIKLLALVTSLSDSEAALFVYDNFDSTLSNKDFFLFFEFLLNFIPTNLLSADQWLFLCSHPLSTYEQIRDLIKEKTNLKINCYELKQGKAKKTKI